MSSLLNYKLEGAGHTIILIHGLFGNLDNLGLLARDLKNDYQVLSVDLRNHGLSLHSDEHNYELIAQDIKELVEHLQLSNTIVVGHSMGGKAAMKFADIAPKHVDKLIVLDMAPVTYPDARHDAVFAGLNAVIKQQPQSRRDAMQVLAEHIEMEGVRQFVGKSLYNTGEHMAWRFNVSALEANYRHILGWNDIEPNTIPTLFIKGADSDYLMPEHQKSIQTQFPNSKAHVIANVGHWLHAEKPTEVLRVIRRFLHDA
ncbi:alpha/beta fold hydrolase [Vibrio palustris]|uniref:Esterase YbfF n=1 Tax=Vibrio palustris TaxID=1918946 RepID=A0A1R4B0B3_9VIBR|nr:alpha/beta fold hydrolase [Vibrio palustris]SJL82366.1 Esterase YbfF [Vibrio palustris]